MRMNVTWPLCVCLCGVCRHQSPIQNMKDKEEQTSEAVQLSVCCRCAATPPYGTIRANPISRGINGRPIAVEKDTGTCLFWLTSSESDEGRGELWGGSQEEATEVNVAQIGEARLYFAWCRKVSPHSERNKTHNASSGWFLRGLENTNKTQLPWRETTESQTVTRLRKKNTEANPELLFYISAPISINIHIFQPLRNIQSCLKYAYSEMALNCDYFYQIKGFDPNSHCQVDLTI